jgi:hypothetical protein
VTKIKKLLSKLQEPSTIKGMIVIAALLGIQVDPELQNQILIGAAAVYSLIQVFVEKD